MIRWLDMDQICAMDIAYRILNLIKIFEVRVKVQTQKVMHAKMLLNACIHRISWLVD